MKVSLTVVLMLLGVTTCVRGTHFRGGSFNWRPLDENNRAEVTFSIGFNGFRVLDADEYPTPGHDVCRHIGMDNLKTIGSLVCDECVNGTPYKEGLYWQCTDFNQRGDWDIGGKTLQVTVPEDTKTAVLYYNTCCWVGDIKNVPPGYNLGWRMITEIDLNPRRDNGLLNSSPITSPIPLQLFHQGCNYWLEIAVTDPDDDEYRCRYTDASKGECYEGDRNTVCGELDYVTIYPNCTLLFNATGQAGLYAVRVIIEDLDQYGDPLSKISQSFLLEVSTDFSTCKAPIILLPEKGCKTVAVNQPFQITIVAEVGAESPTIDRIESIKPMGMIESPLLDVGGHPLRKSLTLTWTPQTDNIGRHNVGFNAVDTRGFSSGWSYITLNVVTGDELYPLADSSNPSRDQRKTSLKNWIIIFNKPVRRPHQPVYIVLLDQSGEVASRIDSSDPRQVMFRENFIEFDVHLNVAIEGTHSFRLQINEGVAIDEEPGSCVLSSQAKEWIVHIESNQPATDFPPPITITRSAPIEEHYTCADGNMDIALPPSAKTGQECFVRPSMPSFIVSSLGDNTRSANIPYKICCEDNCY
ncbi:uncharacterized protein [Amphiura filiformis]|uniref:uncharacterized protein n=1 Tax=Amphiura filiformis TaxID=82378 RepID=UPI003B226C1A